MSKGRNLITYTLVCRAQDDNGSTVGLYALSCKEEKRCYAERGETIAEASGSFAKGVVFYTEDIYKESEVWDT